MSRSPQGERKRSVEDNEATKGETTMVRTYQENIERDARYYATGAQRKALVRLGRQGWSICGNSTATGNVYMCRPYGGCCPSVTIRPDGLVVDDATGDPWEE